MYSLYVIQSMIFNLVANIAFSSSICSQNNKLHQLKKEEEKTTRNMMFVLFSFFRFLLWSCCRNKNDVDPVSHIQLRVLVFFFFPFSVFLAYTCELTMPFIILNKYTNNNKKTRILSCFHIQLNKKPVGHLTLILFSLFSFRWHQIRMGISEKAKN